MSLPAISCRVVSYDRRFVYVKCYEFESENPVSHGLQTSDVVLLTNDSGDKSRPFASSSRLTEYQLGHARCQRRTVDSEWHCVGHADCTRADARSAFQVHSKRTLAIASGLKIVVFRMDLME